MQTDSIKVNVPLLAYGPKEVKLTRSIVNQLKRFDPVRHGCTRDDHKECFPVATCVVDREVVVLFKTPDGVETCWHYVACGLDRSFGEWSKLPRVIFS